MITPKGVAGTAMIAAIGGLAAAIGGVVTGNVPLAVAGFAVVLGANLAPAVADWWAVHARHEASCQRERERAASVAGRDVQPDIQEQLAEVKSYYARSARSLESGEGRFQELVSLNSALDPPGWDRQH
jgi:hypothetical protein